MLESFARHGFFDLKVAASGDLHIDDHHTVEDVGIVLGRAFRQALGDRSGIRRFGSATVPLDEALCAAVVDISGRSYLAYNVPIEQERVGSFQTVLVHDFMKALADETGMNLHLNAARGPQSPSCDRGGLQSAGARDGRGDLLGASGGGSAIDERHVELRGSIPRPEIRGRDRFDLTDRFESAIRGREQTNTTLKHGRNDQ